MATCRYVDEEDSVLKCDVVVEIETSAPDADEPEENFLLLASTPASLISSQTSNNASNKSSAGAIGASGDMVLLGVIAGLKLMLLF